MVLNQLQSLLAVRGSTNGKKLTVNFEKHLSKRTQLVADLYTMLIFDEGLLKDRVGPQNYR